MKKDLCPEYTRKSQNNTLKYKQPIFKKVDNTLTDPSSKNKDEKQACEKRCIYMH